MRLATSQGPRLVAVRWVGHRWSGLAMHPLPRFTALQDRATGAWYVFDRLRRRLIVPVRSDAETARAQAGLWEEFWRDRCARWQGQEGPGRRRPWWSGP